MFDYSKSPIKGKCLVKHCRNHSVPKKGNLCHKHYQQKWRANNPERYAYRNLKDSALRRKLEFNISYDYFRGLADGMRYFDRACEQWGEVATIDRIDASKGYVEGNIQVITLSENIIKGNKERYLPEYVQALMERKRLEELERPEFIPTDNEPF